MKKTILSLMAVAAVALANDVQTPKEVVVDPNKPIENEVKTPEVKIDQEKAKYLLLKEELSQIEFFKYGSYRIEGIKDLPSIYQLRVFDVQNKKYFDSFLTKDKNVLVGGQGINLITKQPLILKAESELLAEQKKKEAALKAFKESKDISALTFGSGEKEYLVVTDPECPFCHRFEKDWDKIESKVKFNVLFHPLKNIHFNAEGISLKILSLKTNEEKIQMFQDVKKFYTSKGQLKDKIGMYDFIDDYNTQGYEMLAYLIQLKHSTLPQMRKEIAQMEKIKIPANKIKEKTKNMNMVVQNIATMQSRLASFVKYVKDKHNIDVALESSLELTNNKLAKINKHVAKEMVQLKKMSHVVQSMEVGGTPTVLDTEGNKVNWTLLVK